MKTISGMYPFEWRAVSSAVQREGSEVRVRRWAIIASESAVSAVESERGVGEGVRRKRGREKKIWERRAVVDTGLENLIIMLPGCKSEWTKLSRRSMFYIT